MVRISEIVLCFTYEFNSHFVNFIFRLSIIFLLLQLIFNLFIVPKAQNIGRVYIKNSNIDFLPKLISEKKFISVLKDLTIFVENYKKDGLLDKVFIKEKVGFSI